MSLSKKAKIFIGGGLTVAAVFCAIIGYGIYSAYSFFKDIGAYRNVEIPAQLQTARIFKGADFLTKNDFYKLEILSYPETISRSLQIADEKKRAQFIAIQTAKGIYGFDDLKVCGREIVAAGRFGGFVFDWQRNLTREIHFEPSVQIIKIGWYEDKEHKAALGNLKIVELDNRGTCGFLAHDYREGATLYDLDGAKIWSYGAETPDLVKGFSDKNNADADREVFVTEAAVADLDGDGAAEIIVSRKNDGIRVFDRSNKEKWFQPDESPYADFRLIDVDGDGAEDLVEFQGMSSTVRDKATGNIIGKIEIDGWRKDFLSSEDSEKKKIAQLFHIDGNKLFLSDVSNKTLLETEAPLSEIKIEPVKSDHPPPAPIAGDGGTIAAPVGDGSGKDTESVYEPRAAWVKLRKDEPKYLAVIASFISIPRSHLYVYDEQGTLVYHELLPENAETIAAVPTANAAEEILIGGKDTIWRYAAK